MKASNRVVNWFMRLRKSSKPKLMLGSWSAMEGTSCEVARIELLRDGSKVVMAATVIVMSWLFFDMCFGLGPVIDVRRDELMSVVLAWLLGKQTTALARKERTPQTACTCARTLARFSTFGPTRAMHLSSSPTRSKAGSRVLLSPRSGPRVQTSNSKHDSIVLRHYGSQTSHQSQWLTVHSAT